MAKVTINGKEYDSWYPSQRFAAFTDHGVQIDRDGNVRARSFVGLAIRTSGTVVQDRTVPEKPAVFAEGRDPNVAASEIFDAIDRAGRGEV